MEPAPALGRIRPRSILIVVVLPAPFGPTNPHTEPRGMARPTPSTTVRSPNFLVSPSVSTARDAPAGWPIRRDARVTVMPEPYGPGRRRRVLRRAGLSPPR